MEIGTTKQILINYKGLPVNVIVSFYVFTLVYRFAFMRKKKEKIEDNKNEKEKVKELNENKEKEKKVE